MTINRQRQKPIIEYYDIEAPSYAEKYCNELLKKPYDRYILSRFIEKIPQDGSILEIGCGPGQVSAFLNKENRFFAGLDLSVGMLNEAKKSGQFDLVVNGNYFTLPFRDRTFNGILAFYAIVHDETAYIESFLSEVKRVLKPNGLFLLAFHTGSERIKTDNNNCGIEYIFHNYKEVCDCIIESEFLILEGVARLPYHDAEYPSERAYFLLEKE